MKIVFTIQVGIDVPSYVQAGEVLDQITRELADAVGPKGSYDVQDFRARHRPVHEFGDTIQAMPSEIPVREGEY